jgi:hypothetical protein
VLLCIKMVTTSKNINLWLIGELKEELLEEVTPTNRQILQVYFYQVLVKKQTERPF